jgi:hypothetical protein
VPKEVVFSVCYDKYLAEGVRFELTIPLRVCRFSRPVP